MPFSRLCARLRIDFRGLCLLAVAGALVVWPDTAHACEERRVLLLASLRLDSAISGTNAERFVQGLRENGGCLEYYTEHLDTAQFGETDNLAVYRDFIARKYAGIRFDLIITFNRPALGFIAAYGQTLFPGTPIFFIAGKGLEVENRSPGPGFAGAVYKVDLRPTLATALRLQPSIRRVYVVSGASTFDRNYEQGTKDQLETFAPYLEFTYLSGLPLGELEERLRSLPPGSVVFLMVVSTDHLGNRLLRDEVVARVSAASTAPVYSPTTGDIGGGTVGGSVIDVNRVLEAASDLPRRLLRGETPESIGVVEFDPTVVAFDWHQLQRFGIPESRLPEGSTVLFRNPTFWERHRRVIAGAATITLLQSVLIVGLVVQRRRRRRAELAARDLATRLLTATETERARVARDLHDGVSQEVASLSLDISCLQVDESDPALPTKSALRRRLDRVAGELRALSHELHPAVVPRLGLIDGLRAHCAEIERQRGLTIGVSASEPLDDLPDDLVLSLFRTVREAIQNSVRHGRARRISVALDRRPGELAITVADDGVGFDPAAAERSAGLGLLSIRERANLLGGRARIESHPGAGTTIEVVIPATPSEIVPARSGALAGSGS